MNEELKIEFSEQDVIVDEALSGLIKSITNSSVVYGNGQEQVCGQQHGHMKLHLPVLF